ncbi:MAG: metal-sensing transcriptional repressor [Clostridium sp.]
MDNKKCCNKTTHRTDKEKKIITNRINRIEGQLRGIKKMIEEDAYCNDVLIQLSAIENSVKSLSNHILENHLYNCVTKDLEDGNLEIIDELISLFKKFNKK